MSGRPDFSQPGSQGSGQTVAVNQRPEISTFDNRPSTSVSGGDSDVVEIYSPVQSTYRTLSTVLKAPSVSNATTGTHSIIVKMPGPSSVFRAVSNYNDPVDWHGAYRSATDTKEPATDAGALQALQSSMATENDPIVIRYNNNTDAAQDSERRYSFAFEEASY